MENTTPKQRQQKNDLSINKSGASDGRSVGSGNWMMTNTSHQKACTEARFPLNAASADYSKKICGYPANLRANVDVNFAIEGWVTLIYNKKRILPQTNLVACIIDLFKLEH